MEAKVYTEIRALFTEYLTEKKLRKTEERYAIFKEICAFPGHFDVCMLSDGEKVSYVVAVLSEKYSVSERKVYALVKRFQSDCKIFAV